ncbi:uncharacterized protein LOC135824479 [Sycon ciliatum]|uniref:uncharacterized protein LOC135824479 n=1 Tax=Sycon ciliatum TaxID=27933 RepID=UPI0020AED6C8|eukprot:scpid76286/ scgid18811/ 
MNGSHSGWGRKLPIWRNTFPRLQRIKKSTSIPVSISWCLQDERVDKEIGRAVGARSTMYYSTAMLSSLVAFMVLLLTFSRSVTADSAGELRDLFKENKEALGLYRQYLLVKGGILPPSSLPSHTASSADIAIPLTFRVQYGSVASYRRLAHSLLSVQRLVSTMCCSMANSFPLLGQPCCAGSHVASGAYETLLATLTEVEAQFPLRSATANSRRSQANAMPLRGTPQSSSRPSFPVWPGPPADLMRQIRTFNRARSARSATEPSSQSTPTRSGRAGNAVDVASLQTVLCEMRAADASFYASSDVMGTVFSRVIRAADRAIRLYRRLQDGMNIGNLSQSTATATNDVTCPDMSGRPICANITQFGNSDESKGVACRPLPALSALLDTPLGTDHVMGSRLDVHVIRLAVVLVFAGKSNFLLGQWFMPRHVPFQYRLAILRAEYTARRLLLQSTALLIPVNEQ